MRTLLQSAFVLHHRPYRETSVLLDVLTESHGRVALVAKGIRTKKSPLKSLLQPFTPLVISWQGRTELMTMLTVESQGLPITLKGECLLSGFYLNELLIRLIQKYDPHPGLFSLYQDTLLALQGDFLQQKHLRLFEKNLLELLGYGVSLQFDTQGELIDPTAEYRFYHELGFTRCVGIQEETMMVFKGSSLLEFHEGTLQSKESLQDSKRLMRIALLQRLGSEPLQSRQLFREVLV